MSIVREQLMNEITLCQSKACVYVDEQRLVCRHCPHRRRCSTSPFYFQATKRPVLLSLRAFVRSVSNKSDERKCSSSTCSIGQRRKKKSIVRSFCWFIDMKIQRWREREKSRTIFIGIILLILHRRLC